MTVTPFLHNPGVWNLDVDRVMQRVAERQHQALSREQASRAGASRVMLSRRVLAGRWRWATRRVLVAEGAPSTFEQRCMVAVLDAGHAAVVCRFAAAALWGLPGFDPPEDIESTRFREKPRRPTSSGMAHEPLLLPPHHRAVVRGVPVTSVPRTIFDLASCTSPKRLARTFDNATSRNLTTRTEVHRVAEELMKRGRPGTKVMRALLAARPIGERSTESGLEDRLLVLLLDAGLPQPENQADLGGEDGWIGRVDFYYRAERLIVEADSDRHHTEPEDVTNDERRDARFRAAGFEVVRVKEEEIERFPAVAVRKVREGFAERRAA